MVKQFLGRIVLLRHGEAEYDEYPDITSIGVASMKDSASSIVKLLDKDNSNNGDFNVIIVASPTPRAITSAAVIASLIDYTGGAVEEEPDIQTAIVKDPDTIETDLEICERLFKYFGKVIKRLLEEPKPPLNFICVSHYETLRHFVEDLFEDYTKDELLNHGELIVVSVFNTCIKDTVEIEVTFRENKRNSFFNYG